MLKDIEDQHIELIITKDFSRLGREFIETIFYITRFFPKHCVRYIAINEAYDSIKQNSNSTEIMLGIKGWLNDFYIKDTSTKIKLVKQQKSENGNYLGFIAPYGYNKIRLSDGKITLKEDCNVSNIIKLIFQKTIEGMNRNDLAELLNSSKVPSPMKYMKMTKSNRKNYYDKWTSAIIYRIIRNKTYTGNTYKCKSIKKDYKQKKRDYIRIKDREIIYDTHPAIIDEITFEKANSMIRCNKKIDRLKDYKGFLSGLVYCGECGKKMNVSSRKKESGRIIYQFYCTNGKNKNKECINTKVIFTKKLEDIVYNYISTVITNIPEEKIIEESNKFITNKRNMKNEIENLKKEIDLKKVNIKNLYLKKVNGQITVNYFIKKRNEINEQIKEREKRISQISEYIDKAIQKKEIGEQYENFKNENVLMKYVNNLVKSINFYKDGKIKIMFSFW